MPPDGASLDVSGNLTARGASPQRDDRKDDDTASRLRQTHPTRILPALFPTPPHRGRQAHPSPVASRRDAAPHAGRQRNHPEFHNRTIWISDIHLGTRGCKADLLLDFMRQTESDYLNLVGDCLPTTPTRLCQTPSFQAVV